MEVITWYVVFCARTENNFLLRPFLEDGFKHCLCFRQLGDNIIQTDPTGYNINTSTFKWDSALQYAYHLERNPNYRVLRFKYSVADIKKSFNVGNILPTCVTIVKMTIGLRSLCVTPYQLYKESKRLGAREL